MKKEVNFELVKDNGLQKFYKSSKMLTRGLVRLTGKITEWSKDNGIDRVKDEHKHLFKDEGFDIVCISNARTHSEKLAFAAFIFDDGEYGRTQMQIEGVHTMMIHGGDIDSCWDDEKYLRLIARHNGFSQDKVTIKS